MKANVTKTKPILSLSSENYEHRKYRILEILDNLPARQSKTLKRNLPIILNISRITLSNWINTSISDTLDIPSTKLAIIAQSFNVPILDLFNFQLPKNQLQEIKQSKEKSLLKSTGLVI